MFLFRTPLFRSISIHRANIGPSYGLAAGFPAFFHLAFSKQQLGGAFLPLTCFFQSCFYAILCLSDSGLYPLFSRKRPPVFSHYLSIRRAARISYRSARWFLPRFYARPLFADGYRGFPCIRPLSFYSAVFVSFIGPLISFRVMPALWAWTPIFPTVDSFLG